MGPPPQKEVIHIGDGFTILDNRVYSNAANALAFLDPDVDSSVTTCGPDLGSVSINPSLATISYNPDADPSVQPLTPRYPKQPGIECVIHTSDSGDTSTPTSDTPSPSKKVPPSPQLSIASSVGPSDGIHRDDAWALSHSRGTRIYIAFLLAMLFTSWLACIVINVTSMAVPIPYWSPQVVETFWDVALVMFPRLFTYVCCCGFLMLFFVTMLSYKQEPTTLLLDNYLPREKFPTVDIILPRYKEEWELFKPTVLGSLNLDYPPEKLNVWICDDGARSGCGVGKEVEELQVKYPNLRYLTRPTGEHAKAGNLNNCLANAKGDLVSVFDADHVPRADFLLRIIPHLFPTIPGGKLKDGYLPRDPDFRKGKISFVQTTQIFYNADKLMVRVLDGVQHVFYSLIMPATNGLNASFCVGTGYVMRRDALDDIGGYVCGCAVEDVLTSMELHSKGWSSKYVEIFSDPWIIGLSPQTLSEFYQQRERWVAGSGHLLLYRLAQKRKSQIPPAVFRLYLMNNWYFLVMVLVMFIVFARALLYLMYKQQIGRYPLHVAQLLVEYVPVYTALLAVPRIGPRNKCEWLTATMCLLPTYLVVTWAWFRGKLNPDKHNYRVQASSESFGDAWPHLAWINVAWFGSITVWFIVMAIPQTGLITTPTDWVVPLVTLISTYIFNIPVFCDLWLRVYRLFVPPKDED